MTCWLALLSPAKRLQHVNATYSNIVGGNMLLAFDNPVTTYYDRLGVVGSSLNMVKFNSTTPNMSENVAPGWPNECDMLRPTMLRYVGLTCCDCLSGTLCKPSKNRPALTNCCSVSNRCICCRSK